jgi:alkanesulfonate monooxygenase SsuD/methylene tetrahydromethanopterin reductase-like flavin-dependent oxidoreductase (luciferase family)
MKIYTAAITPKGLACSGEVADGVFPVWMDPGKPEALVPYIEEGVAKSGGTKSMLDFDIAPFVTCIVGDDLDACRMPVKGMLALYIGGMGARGKNFYTDYATRLGYEEAAIKIQDLYLDGKKGEAMAAVPDELADSISLIGTPERITERVQAWKGSAATTLLLGAQQPEAIRLLAELAL